MPNKIQYGISNVYYAVMTADGVYSTPVHMPGGENLTISSGNGSDNIIWADNINYWNKTTSTGKSGDLQMAKFPKSFYVDVLGQTSEEEGGVTESPNDTSKPFALMFQLEGDAGGRRVCWYNCTAAVPTFTAATATENITEASETSAITAAPVMVGGKLRTQYSCESGESKYEDFFDLPPFGTAAQ